MAIPAMLRKVRSSPHQNSRISLAQLRRELEVCADRVEKLERESQTYLQRMASMQSEIDHLRALLRGL